MQGSSPLRDQTRLAASTLTLTQDLLALTERARERAREDPFGNPVLAVALAISRRIDDGDLTDARIESLIQFLRDQAFADRARRLADYVGATDGTAAELAYAALAQRLVRPGPS